jgi:hypothetical protein
MGQQYACSWQDLPRLFDMVQRFSLFNISGGHSSDKRIFSRPLQLKCDKILMHMDSDVVGWWFEKILASPMLMKN